ncbi:MAG: hypothetical protein AB1656_08135, partial [Candidatus Omnitrophota bacterium]
REYFNKSAFSPTGRHLLIWGDESAYLYDFSEGYRIKRIKLSSLPDFLGAQDFAFLDNGEQYAAAINKPSRLTLRFFDAATREKRMETFIDYDGTKGFVTFSPDGKKVFFSTQGAESALLLYDIESESLLAFPRPTSSITSLDFSQDGARLATGHEDGTINIWNISADSAGIMDWRRD